MWGRFALVLCCLAMVAGVARAQKQSSASSAQAARSALAEKARRLESRGRPDMALQIWQQILLSDPDNAEALAGKVREDKLLGNADKAAESLHRLRAIHPDDPNIARLESMSNQTQSEQLKQAGEFVKQNRPEDAMRIFRQLYGEHAPSGDSARVYYQALYATKGGKAAAVAGMRQLAARNPGNPQYAVALGTMLTYDAGTRAEGIRSLASRPQDPDAQAAIRQALIWNAANPAAAGQLREYLKTHPQDKEMARLLQQNEALQAQSNTGIAAHACSTSTPRKIITPN